MYALALCPLDRTARVKAECIHAERVSPTLSCQFGQIALDNETTIQTLLGEAIDLLLPKYWFPAGRRALDPQPHPTAEPCLPRRQPLRIEPGMPGLRQLVNALLR